MSLQQTLRRPVEGRGIGLHRGEDAEFCIEPASADTGIVFIRVDVDSAVEIPAHVDNVVDTKLCTTLGKNGVTVQTIEHMVAGLSALGVDNARVRVRGPEIPILDGSADGFVGRIIGAGLCQLDAPRRYVAVTRTVTVSDADRWARLEPAGSFFLSCAIDFAHPLVGTQRFEGEVDRVAFVRELSRARTFGFVHEIARLREAGFARGGSLANALVFDGEEIQNAEGQRFADEPVRHKALDAVGDLALVGAPLRARYVSYKSGHSLNVRLIRKLLGDASQFERAQESRAIPREGHD